MAAKMDIQFFFLETLMFTSCFVLSLPVLCVRSWRCDGIRVRQADESANYGTLKAFLPRSAVSKGRSVRVGEERRQNQKGP